MRLLFAHDHRFRPGPGGEFYTPSSYPASIWDRYLEHFDEVTVVARSGAMVEQGSGLARTDHEGVTFDLLPNASSLRQLLLPSRALDERMRAAVQSADAVVARLPSELGLLALRHARSLGKPHAVEVVGCIWDGLFNYGTLSGRLYAPLAFLRNRRAIADAPMALYVTSSFLQRRYPTRGYSESASDVFVGTMSDSENARRESRLAELAKGRKPVFGTIAKLNTKSKGVQTALAAIAKFRAAGNDYVYRVLGPGPLDQWRQLAKDFGVSDIVHFDGTRGAGEGVSAWLDEIDIYLQPSFQEGLPRATIEAMSRGAACIGSTCGGIPELLPAENLHRPGDVAGLADRMQRLIAHPEEVAAASREARRRAAQFDPHSLQERRRQFYARLRGMVEGTARP